MAFCTSLRKRQEWSLVPNALLSISSPKWQEKRLETHDLSIPLPQAHHQHRSQVESILFLLMSATDLMDPNSAMSRIQRLQHQGGGRHFGVVFLLQEKGEKGSTSGTIAFMRLQLSLQQGEVSPPLLPLHTISALQNTILGFQRSLTTTRHSRTPVPNPLQSLLPFCTVAPPIPERSVNVLSEVCSSIPALAQAATTPSGQAVLRDTLPEEKQQVAEDIIEFWGVEIIAD